MKALGITLFLLTTPALAVGIKGRVSSDEACRSGKIMVWLSQNEKEFKKKELLLHTQVPERGTFEFYVKPGDYLVVASNEKGCAVEQPVRISDKDVLLQLDLSEKKK